MKSSAGGMMEQIEAVKPFRLKAWMFFARATTPLGIVTYVIFLPDTERSRISIVGTKK